MWSLIRTVKFQLFCKLKITFDSLVTSYLLNVFKDLLKKMNNQNIFTDNFPQKIKNYMCLWKNGIKKSHFFTQKHIVHEIFKRT